MRHLAIAALIASPLLAAGCDNSSSNSNAENSSANAAGAGPAADLYVIEAGTITGNRVPGINSWFKIVRAQPGDRNAIESDRYGGACIVFRASDLGYVVKKPDCAIDKDCDHSGGAGYCEAASKVCWARPNVTEVFRDPLCNRSGHHDPIRQWNAGQLNWIAGQPIPVPQGLKPNAQARTIALLWRAPGMTPPALAQWGDPKPIP